MNIYIVTGSRGEYDDYQTFNVKAFFTEQAAQEWINKQPGINYDALNELSSLKDENWKSANSLYSNEEMDDWSDAKWEEFHEFQAELDNKSLEIIQEKYPDADLTEDNDFHGYAIEYLDMEENQIDEK